MPLPKPHPDEEQDAFIGRCMRDAATQEMDVGDVSEEKAHQMRVAACFSAWRETKEAAGDMETKTAAGSLEVKSEDRGEVEAVVARLNVVDKDGDYTLPGAFKEGAKVKMSGWGHNSARGPLEPPVGKGTIHVQGDEVVLKGRFFMSTDRGRDAFALVKEFGPDLEWSYGYRVTQRGELTKDLKAAGAKRVIAATTVFEASPVFEGAGVGTYTLSTKDADDAKAAAAEAEAKRQAEEAELKAAGDRARLAELQGQQAAAREGLERMQQTQRYLDGLKP